MAEASRSVFFYTDSRLIGGAEEAMLMLIDSLDPEAWRPTLLLDDVPETDGLAQRARAMDIHVRLIAPMPLGLVGARRVPRLVRLLRAAHADVFHAHLSWPLAAKYPLLAAVAAGVPAVLATVHLIPEFELGRGSFVQLRALSTAVGRYIAVSQHIANELSQRFRWPERKIEVIHNCVCTARFELGAPPGLRAALTGGGSRPVVFTCARLHPQKGHSILLRAAARVPDTVFALAGDGPLRAVLEAEASELGIAERVRFLGMRSDIPELLAASDVFALPSLYEGTSLALLEAMAAGRAIVTTGIGGTDELLEDGISGLLVAPGDADALAEAIRGLLADVNRRAELGRRAHERAARDFAPAAMASRVTAVYDRLLAGTDRAAA